MNDNKSEKLISAKEVRLQKIKKEHLVFDKSAVLIKHSITDATYLVSKGFLDGYAINRIAAQDKFKGKTSFPDKVYKNKEEITFDDLIFDYNKSRIASMGDFD